MLAIITTIDYSVFVLVVLESLLGFGVSSGELFDHVYRTLALPVPA